MSGRRSRHRRATLRGIPPAPPMAGPPPGLFRRLTALLYDAVLLAGVLFAATLVLLPFRSGEAFQPHDAMFSLYLLAVGFAFFGWFWTHGGQTLGMRAWNIRLRSADGGAVTWRQAAIRAVFALISGGLLGLGYLWVWIDSRRCAWHDLASGTRVIVEEKR